MSLLHSFDFQVTLSGRNKCSTTSPPGALLCRGSLLFWTQQSRRVPLDASKKGISRAFYIGVKTKAPNPATAGAINKDKLVPGDHMLVDHVAAHEHDCYFASRGHESRDDGLNVGPNVGPFLWTQLYIAGESSSNF
jgi:hypothetical protein